MTNTIYGYTQRINIRKIGATNKKKIINKFGEYSNNFFSYTVNVYVYVSIQRFILRINCYLNILFINIIIQGTKNKEIYSIRICTLSALRPSHTNLLPAYTFYIIIYLFFF